MIDGADPAHFSEDRVSRARKQYQCGECRRVIAVGERYHYGFLVTERGDHGVTYRTCEHCMVGPQAWLMRECSGWCYEGVSEDLEDHWQEHHLCDRLELGRLIVGIRRRWLRKDGTLMDMPVVSAQMRPPA